MELESSELIEKKSENCAANSQADDRLLGRANEPPKLNEKPAKIEEGEERLGVRQERVKGKIEHRSQSSPSSLTTHKFGLRPTPSPPRLIIDHQTGDIIESYPEQPVYLRTYQPLDDEREHEDLEDDTTLSEPSQSFPSQQNQLQMSGSNRYRPAIPPPHSAANHNRVYFAPPEPSAGHLFYHDQPLIGYQQPLAAMQTGYGKQQEHQEQLKQHEQLQQRQQQQTDSLAGSSSNSFKRALNKLNESKTDIAIVTEAEDAPTGVAGRPQLGELAYGRQTRGGMRVTATSGSQADAMLAGGQIGITSKRAGGQLQAANGSKPAAGCARFKHLVPPVIEDFNLYDFFYQFRLLLVCLISSSILYLLVVPLNSGCTQFRPTYTYISMITASVNLICVVIFSLFWYCSGVTRTLYANLSSSAFIITIYSILVAINLALAILFFLINTCHSQRLNSGSTRSLIPIVPHSVSSSSYRLSEGETFELTFGQEFISKLTPNDGRDNSNQQSELMLTKMNPQTDHQTNSHHSQSSLSQLVGSKLSNGSQNWARTRRQLDDDLGAQQQSEHHQLTSSSPANEGDTLEYDTQHNYTAVTQSPIEAFYDYLKEQLIQFRRNFNRFLLKYDLRFIGVLHAICAICLQYMAMRVAVVRSFYCSPRHLYI